MSTGESQNPADRDPFRAHLPLESSDPVRLDDYWLDSRLAATPAGVAYSAHETDGHSVMLLLLSEGAAADAAARSRFAGEINSMDIDTVIARGGQGQDEGRLAVRFRPREDPQLAGLAPLAPWAALAFDGSTEAVREALRVLNAVDLAASSPLGEPSGPEFALHWAEATNPGRTRIWPLAWPGRKDRDGWLSILVSWLLMLLLSALALLLALLAFQNAPLVSPPPPVGGGSPPSGSPQFESPDSASPSGEDSSTPDPSQSTSGEPTKNRRL
ncbi:hypothetical protein [Tessaracoccus sp. OH4464_COT-324]|uniref:hypothetical protein n=1 Tax=Tessaracoccus sp. OH4464_COT-324 TaxID=2491059 RepID=UPI000F62FAE4|nr:hypothetical protein [Tessaracoccus sp. OH4464_COT-324]RRD47844.1 hypothetical protein EII42_00925 [Tessaracoccus sp. OH4464_COT-324]